MRFILLSLTLLTLHLNAPSSEHDFHVGIAQMHYSEENKTYQIAIKLFTDDLEKALTKSTGSNVHLGETNELINADELVFEYIQSKFKLIDNREALKLIEIGRETEIDLTWLYLESELIKPIKNLIVKSEILFEVFPDQTFLIHLDQGDTIRSLYLHQGKNQDSF